MTLSAAMTNVLEEAPVQAEVHHDVCPSRVDYVAEQVLCLELQPAFASVLPSHCCCSRI